jgi:hypothetical protein
MPPTQTTPRLIPQEFSGFSVQFSAQQPEPHRIAKKLHPENTEN